MIARITVLGFTLMAMIGAPALVQAEASPGPDFGRPGIYAGAGVTVGFENFDSPFWTNDYDLCISFHKLLVVLTQLRHVFLAERSYKAPVEYQDDVFFAPIVRETYCLPLEIVQGKIRSDCINLHSIRHGLTSSILWVGRQPKVARNPTCCKAIIL